MNAKFDLLMHLLSFLIFTTLIYGQCRINTKNSRLFKRGILFVSNLFPKDIAEDIFRVVFLIVINSLFLVFLYLNNNIIIRNVFMKITFMNFISIVVAFIGFIEILFITITVIYFLCLQKDINKIFRDIDWLKVDINKLIYTGYIRTLVVAIFEVIFFFNFIFGMLIDRFNLPLGISIFITVLYYCYGKFIIRTNMQKCIMLSILGLAISLTILILINVVDSLLVGILFMYVILVMIAFKDIKVRF